MRSISPQPTPHLSPTNSADLHLSDAPLLGTMKFNEEQKAFWKTHTRPEVSSKVQKLVMLRTIAHDQEKAEGVNKEWSEAANWYIKAACQGEAKAQFALGLIYEKGKGVKKIPDEALKWYSKAAKQGNAEAIRKVAKLKKSGFFQ